MIPKTTNATERTSVPIHFIIISPLIPITINATIAIIPTINWNMDAIKFHLLFTLSPPLTPVFQLIQFHIITLQDKIKEQPQQSKLLWLLPF